ncbi:MAG: DUF4058 family protein [Actinomycetota bacterium]
MVPVPVPRVSVEIRDTADRRFVAIIEVLSPTNKGPGRDEDLAERQRTLMTSAHLLEFDLLHEGRRPPMRQALPDASYFVFLSRGEEQQSTASAAFHRGRGLGRTTARIGPRLTRDPAAYQLPRTFPGP